MTTRRQSYLRKEMTTRRKKKQYYQLCSATFIHSDIRKPQLACLAYYKCSSLWDLYASAKTKSFFFFVEPEGRLILLHPLKRYFRNIPFLALLKIGFYDFLANYRNIDYSLPLLANASSQTMTNMFEVERMIIRPVHRYYSSRQNGNSIYYEIAL